jgi:hypothetical protein
MRNWTMLVVSTLFVVVPGGAAADTDVASDTAVDAASDTSLDAGDTAVDTSLDAGDPALDATPDVQGDTAVDAASDTGDTATDTAADTSREDGGGPADVEMIDVVDGDAGPTDTADDAAMDVEADDASMDVEAEDTGERDTAFVDIRRQVDADAGEPERARFFGQATLQSEGDYSGIQITLERTDDDGGSFQQTTDADGEFEFEELPLGSYEVELARDGFVTIAESFELVGDREARYTLYRDQQADVRVRAVFTHVDEPPEEVDFQLAGERGEFAPDEPIAVEDEVAEWTVDEVGVGAWEVMAMADGFKDLSYQFAVSGSDDGQSNPVDVRLFMTPDVERPPPPDTSGCACPGSESGRGGGGVPGPTTPGPTGAVLLALSAIGSARLIAYYGSKDA